MGDGVKSNVKTIEDFLAEHPYCAICQQARNQLVPSFRAVRNNIGRWTPVCEDHYKARCIAMGDKILMQDGVLSY